MSDDPPNKEELGTLSNFPKVIQLVSTAPEI